MPGEPFVGEIYIGGMNFAPAGYALCNGQLLSISENETLFQLIGTTYGGDGETTFAVPDLQGRTPVGQGQGAGLSNRILGEMGGTESVTLVSTQMPAHSHTLSAVSEAGDSSNPQGALLANSGALDKEYSSTTSPIVTMHASAIGTSGGNQPHNNMPPYLGLNFYISLFGIFPPRN